MSAAAGFTVPVPFLRTLDLSPDGVTSASAGAAARSLGTSGILGAFLISMSSTSKQRSPAGAPGLDGTSPYAMAAGIQSLLFSPTTMSWTPSVQPLMTWLRPNSIGSPRVTELSNILPVLSHPV